MLSNQISKRMKSDQFSVSILDVTVMIFLDIWTAVNREEILKFIHHVKKLWDYHFVISEVIAVFSSSSDLLKSIKERALKKELTSFQKIMSLKIINEELTASHISFLKRQSMCLCCSKQLAKNSLICCSHLNEFVKCCQCADEKVFCLSVSVSLKHE